MRPKCPHAGIAPLFYAATFMAFVATKGTTAEFVPLSSFAGGDFDASYSHKVSGDGTVVIGRGQTPTFNGPWR